MRLLRYGLGRTMIFPKSLYWCMVTYGLLGANIAIFTVPAIVAWLALRLIQGVARRGQKPAWLGLAADAIVLFGLLAWAPIPALLIHAYRWPTVIYDLANSWGGMAVQTKIAAGVVSVLLIGRVLRNWRPDRTVGAGIVALTIVPAVGLWLVATVIGEEVLGQE